MFSKENLIKIIVRVKIDIFRDKIFKFLLYLFRFLKEKWPLWGPPRAGPLQTCDEWPTSSNIMMLKESIVISQNSLKTVKKGSVQIRTLGKHFFLLQLLGQTICQTFLCFLIYFAKIFKTKISLVIGKF